MADLGSTAPAEDIDNPIVAAERLDAQSRHGEAVELLARAANAGDLDALTRLGLRLLVGQHGLARPADGLRLLANAAEAGSGDAAGRLAVVAGLGFYARQSWPGALDCLQRSAAMGSPSSQEQLRLLAQGPAAEPVAAGDDWAGLRRAVDLGFWTSAPSSSPLCPSPLIYSMKGLIPPAVSAWVIQQSRPRLAPAEVYDPQSGRSGRSEETRLNSIANFGLAETCLLNLMVQARVSAAVRVPASHLEAFAVLHYEVGEEYGEHFDYLDPQIPGYAAEIARMGQRVATCLIYLNDDFEGGVTEFPQLGLSYRGAAGDALVFFSADAAGAPDRRTVHAGRPPTAGQKWLLSQFIRNRPVIGG